jgi:hypothetical protein
MNKMAISHFKVVKRTSYIFKNNMKTIKIKASGVKIFTSIKFELSQPCDFKFMSCRVIKFFCCFQRNRSHYPSHSLPSILP